MSMYRGNRKLKKRVDDLENAVKTLQKQLKPCEHTCKPCDHTCKPCDHTCKPCEHECKPCACSCCEPECPPEPVVEEPVVEEPVEPVVEEPVEPVVETPVEPVVETPVEPVVEPITIEVPSGPIEPEKKVLNALLIGCDYEGTSNELKGCSKDVLDMRELLHKKDYVVDVLCDDTERDLDDIKGHPTYRNLVMEINKLASVENPDKLFFHYSGHGTYTNDSSNDEKDNRDEMIVCTDNTFVSDDVLHKLFSQIPDTRMFLLIDACHSSTALDLKYRFYETEIVENEKNYIKCDTLMISGCKDSQTSADVYMDGSYRGAMTTAFINSYNILGLDVTVENFIKHMRKFLKKNRFEQIPQVTYTESGAYKRKMSYYIE
jgi:hypothetical protein